MQSKYGKGKRKISVPVKSSKTGKVFLRQQVVGSDKLEDTYYNNFGVKIEGNVNGHTNNMLYNGLYLLNQAMPVKELNKLHQLTINVLDNFEEDRKNAKQYVTGKYDDNNSTIYISPKHSQSFAHEYGHYIKDSILSTSDENEKKQLYQFINGLKKTDILDRVKHFQFKSQDDKNKYLQWISTPDELFAKFFEQYVSFKLKGIKNNYISDSYDNYSNKPQFFTNIEFSSRRDDFENLMKSVLGNEIIEKTLDFLLSF